MPVGHSLTVVALFQRWPLPWSWHYFEGWPLPYGRGSDLYIAVYMIQIPFTLALIQMRCEAQPQSNLDTAVARIRQAAEAGADIICLPELFRSTYFCQRCDPALFDLAESIPGPTTERLRARPKSLGKVIVASLFERRGPGLYHNTAVVIDADGSLLGLYRKMHIPGRSALLREVLLHARRPGLQDV